MATLPVYASIMAYDGADIIGFVIDHLIGQSVDGLIVSDNGSTDGTLDILEEKRKTCEERGIDFLLLHDPERAFWVDEKMTHLAAIAAKRAGGSAWIIPADQDEFWGGLGGPIGDVLKGEAIKIATPPWIPAHRQRMSHGMCGFYTHFESFIPTAKDDPNEPNPLYRMNWTFGRGEKRMPEGREQLNAQRVLFPADSDLEERFRISGGGAGVSDRIGGLKRRHAHFVSGGGLFYIRHYPVRSLAQMKKKYRDLKQGTEMTRAAAHVNKHARMIGAFSDEEMEKWYFEKCFSNDPESDPYLVFKPYRG